jgi:hypothetical protein
MEAIAALAPVEVVAACCVVAAGTDADAATPSAYARPVSARDNRRKASLRHATAELGNPETEGVAMLHGNNP